MLDLIIRGLATFYLATAGVEFFSYLLHVFNIGSKSIEHTKRLVFLANKPFNCVLCLSFWFAILVGFSMPFVLTEYLIKVAAIAGVSILISAVYDKLRIYLA